MPMSECEAVEIVTWLAEPKLLREPGEPDPVFSAGEISEARTIVARIEAEYFTIH